MRSTPRSLLTTRLVGVLLVGLGAPAAAALLVRLIEPGIWSDVWAERAGGPFALLSGLVVEWFGVICQNSRWLRSGPAVLAMFAGLLLVFKTRHALGWMPRGMPR